MESNVCSLCSLGISRTPIKEGDHQFCCMGCRAVFQILSSRNALESYREEPIFLRAVQAGIISNPLLIEQLRQKQDSGQGEKWEKFHCEVSDMWCSSCAEVIKWILLQERGVRSCVIDYSTDLAAIEYCPHHISKDDLLAKIRGMGYRAERLQDMQRKAVTFGLYLRFVISVFCAFNMMMFAYPIYASYFDADVEGYSTLFSWLSFFASLPVLGYCAWPILRRFTLSIKAKVFGMETLVVISVCAAFFLSLYELLKGTNHVYFDSMAVIIVFVLLGKIMEAKAKFSAKEAVWRLHRSIPKRGRKRMPDGTVCFVSIKEIQKGDLLVAFAGEKLILDGTVVEGKGTCDESLITGESFPVIKECGDSILGGALLQQGPLTYRVTHTVEESFLSRMISTVEKEIGFKTAYVRMTDVISRWFVPVIIALAVTTALFCWVSGTAVVEAAWRGVAVLLISCPCAIGIAVPLAESNLMHQLANLGVIVRNRGCLSLLGKETVYLFDKTGTITEGRFQLLSGLEKLSVEKKQLLKGLVSQSSHPISCAIDKALELIPKPLEQVEELIGRGVRGLLGSSLYAIGSEEMMRQEGVLIDFPQESTGAISRVFFSEGKNCLACLTMGDRIREGVLELMQSLRAKQTILLSGDSAGTVAAIAAKIGCTDYQACCSPLQKRERIEQLRKQGHIVCMVGDGINDALALTAAHVGISVVTATDISIQVSDLLLATDRLQVIPKAYALAAKARKIIRQNLFWAFFYNIIGVFLAMAGALTPIFAAFAMVTSSLIVLLNASRIRLSFFSPVSQ
jgi:Cu2+-exporting ATPase